jgi:transcriptional regulator with XRE-family HTH domain
LRESIHPLVYSMAKKAKGRVVARFKTTVRKQKHFLKEWRLYRGMTLERAAELAGMTAGNISAMERGDQGFTEHGLAALAQAYEALPGWLIDYDPRELHGFFETVRMAKGEDRGKIFNLANEIAKTILGTGTDG